MSAPHVDPSTSPAAAVAASTSVLTLKHHERIRKAIEKVVAAGQPFDADAIHAALPKATREWLDEHPQVLGGYVQGVVHDGRIRFVGWTDSHRRPGRPQRVWACRKGR